MPVAQPFTTDGVYNGFPDCFPKVDVSDRGDGNPFDFWTTASGFNKDSVGNPSAASIQQSLQLVGKLYWNLYRLELDCLVLGGIDPVTELIIDGEIDQTGEAIEPIERVCRGSLTTLGEQIIDEVAVVTDLRQGEEQGFARMYNGGTADEENFIGYGLGEAAFAAGKSIDIYAFEGLYDAGLSLGGFAIDETDSGRSWNYTYITIGGISAVFVGAGGGGGVSTAFTQDPPATVVTSGATVIAKAEVTSLEFYTYP